MDITEVSILHHIALVLLVLWALVHVGWAHLFAFFVALLYLCAVNARYTLKLQKRLQFEERKCANQRRLLSDTESVRWLNHAIEKIWPICMEHIASQQFLLPIIPWFLDKYKPWTAKKAVMQHLYLGRNPPMFTDIRVHRESGDDDHLVLELGMNFLSADDMSAKLAVQLRKRLGFGITANMHITGMHVEGKILVGVKFLRHWPFIGRVRICFVEPPYFQMTVKPLFVHGVDVTELPGISGWLDKLLDVAFGQTLVEPNMLVVDVEKFVSTPQDIADTWFTVDEKPSIAYVKLEMIEGADMKPSDLNGLSDPYVKGQLGPFRFHTKIQKKTLSPKWHEEFKIPITSWEASNVLELQVRDKDPIFDDILGSKLTHQFCLDDVTNSPRNIEMPSILSNNNINLSFMDHPLQLRFHVKLAALELLRHELKRNCSVNINDLRGGQRHDMWLSLQNIKMGRIRLAITIVEEEPQKEPKDVSDDDTSNMTELIGRTDAKTEALNSEVYRKMADEFEAIDIQGQEKAGLWVHRPGSDTGQKWEPRKGRARPSETELQRQDSAKSQSPSSGSQQSDSGSNEETGDKKRPRLKTIKRGLHKLGSVFHVSTKQHSPREQEAVGPTQRPNLPPSGEKRTSVNIVRSDRHDEKNGQPRIGEGECSSEMGEVDSADKSSESQSKNFLSRKAKSFKSMLSRKDSNRLKDVWISESKDLDNSPETYDVVVNDPLVIAGSLVESSPIPTVDNER